jgi:phosphatidylserine/phosphatidylglycerophosphate/cardiolipin synthase-like enzyme
MNKVYFSPQDQVLRRIKEAMDGASRSIELTLYVFTAAYLSKALISAHKRGVVVRVILDRKEARRSGSRARELLEAGVPTRFLRPVRRGLFHHKFLLVDGQTVITGSGNFTNDMGWRNFEATLFLEEPELLSRFQEEFDRLWNLASPALEGARK